MTHQFADGSELFEERAFDEAVNAYRESHKQFQDGQQYIKLLDSRIDPRFVELDGMIKEQKHLRGYK